MVQEELQSRDIDIIEQDDNALLDGEVWTEVDEISSEVLKTVELPFLRRILWYLDTTQGWAEIARLDKLRAANDNNTEKEKAA